MIITLFLLIVILQIIDIATTIHILNSGGVELNGFMKGLMDKLGVVPALVIGKAAFLAILSYLLITLEGFAFEANLMLVLIIVWYILVVSFNIRNILIK